MSNSRVRKQVDELTLADFERFPVWEFALDEEGEAGQDETTVRPHTHARPLDPTNSDFIVRARFVLADGTALHGYLTLPAGGDPDLGTLQPVILTPGGPVLFWFGRLDPKPDVIASFYARLGKSSPLQVFPLRFETDVSLVGMSLCGEVPGFLVLEDIQSMRTRVIT